MIPGIVAGSRQVVAPGPVFPDIGEPYEGGYFAGLFTGGLSGWAIIVADKLAETSAMWKTSRTTTAGTDYVDDGIANTNAMIATGIANHPAAQHCVGYENDGFTDWYLPSINEHLFIESTLGPSRVTTPSPFKAGESQAYATGIPAGYYVTSTQQSSNNFFFVSMGQNNTTGSASKTGVYKVRPIRRIPIPIA